MSMASLEEWHGRSLLLEYVNYIQMLLPVPSLAGFSSLCING